MGSWFILNILHLVLVQTQTAQSNDASSEKAKDIQTMLRPKASNSNVLVDKAKIKLTKMIIIINIYFTSANTLLTLSFLSSYLFGNSSSITVLITVISNTLLFLAHSTSLIIYFTFDKLYRQTFKAKLKAASKFSS